MMQPGMGPKKMTNSHRLNNQPVLEIATLKTCFQTIHGTVKAVDAVNLEIGAGEVLGLVGESGCGKSVTAMSIMRLLPSPPAFYPSGEIRFKGRNLLQVSDDEIRRIRGNQISMIFQEPMSALNPVFTIGNQIGEVFRVHRELSRAQANEKAIQIMDSVGVPSPEKRVKAYPFELSGGMRQRVMIAMALACRPALLLADEPTTALDVTVQAQILQLMMDLRRDLDTSIILITHDLAVVAETTERMAVMYTGRIVEEASTLEIFDRPLHPYTIGLMSAIPTAEVDLSKPELHEIPGMVPSLLKLPPGCSFAPRCSQAEDICRREKPHLESVAPNHKVACWLVKDV